MSNVFLGLALLGVAYLVFRAWKRSKAESSGTSGSGGSPKGDNTNEQAK